MTSLFHSTQVLLVAPLLPREYNKMAHDYILTFLVLCTLFMFCIYFFSLSFLINFRLQFSWLGTGCLTNIAPSSSFVDLHLASLDPSARYSINTNNAVACKPYWGQSEPPCTCPVSSDQELPSATPSNESACSDDSGIQNVSIPHNSSITVDIDKIMAKIDQDNRILAELDKTRSTIGKVHF